MSPAHVSRAGEYKIYIMAEYMTQRKKLSKRLLPLIISTAVIALTLSAILITNAFIPIKYISAYFNLSKDKPEVGEMRISFMDVGDGNCTIVEFPDGKVALFDGGNGAYDNQLNIFKKLNTFGISKIDYLFCTSSASGNCGGLAEIVRYKNIGKVYSPVYKNYGVTKAYRNFVKSLKRKNESITESAYGVGAYSEEYGYCFYVIYPSKDNSSSASNGVSSPCVWLSYGGVNLLLLGDLSSLELNTLYNSYSSENGFELYGHSIYLEDCDIVKIPAGSKDSPCSAFYDLIQAKTAIFSCNKEPAYALMSDISHYAGDNIYRTGANGTITVSILNNDYKVYKERG